MHRFRLKPARFEIATGIHEFVKLWDFAVRNGGMLHIGSSTDTFGDMCVTLEVMDKFADAYRTKLAELGIVEEK